MGNISNLGRDIQINLMGSSGDIPFHFNVRFSENRVVMNNRKSERAWDWGAQLDRFGTGPFQKYGKLDSIEIKRVANVFQVSVNGQRYPTYDFTNRGEKPVNAIYWDGITVNGASYILRNSYCGQGGRALGDDGYEGRMIDAVARDSYVWVGLFLVLGCVGGYGIALASGKKVEPLDENTGLLAK